MNMTVAQAAQVDVDVARVLSDEVHFVPLMAHGFETADVLRRLLPGIAHAEPALRLVDDDDRVVGQFVPSVRVVKREPRRLEQFRLEAGDIVEVDHPPFPLGLLIDFANGVEGLAVAGLSGADIEHGWSPQASM
ncbi:hypothetical protein D9M68_718500 [compost metagenome]